MDVVFTKIKLVLEMIMLLKIWLYWEQSAQFYEYS